MMKLFSASVLALALAACATDAPAPANVTRVVSTTSFGMCMGYCTTRLEISDGQAVLIRQARGGRGGDTGQPDQRFQRTLSASEWQEIQRLAANADIDALPDVVGCPVCADGGAEGLTIESSGHSESVSFEHGANIAQAQPLLDRVRALRAQLTPENAS
jgi:hypothetical protein